MSSRFEILPSPVPGLVVLQRKPRGDERGFFERMFCTEELRDVLGERRICQINHSVTRHRGSVRGLHFQNPPHAELKVVSCLKGEVFDVAVDLRAGSPTFMRWHGETLSSDNHTSMFIPEGFAHGFQTLTDDCEMLYFHTAAYQPEAEGGLNVQDPRLAIQWPLPVAHLSPRDAAHPLLDDGFVGVAP